MTAIVRTVAKRSKMKGTEVVVSVNKNLDGEKAEPFQHQRAAALEPEKVTRKFFSCNSKPVA